ncbi:SusC/RagA family TonB-linked outer membrane protein [Sphingobacterium sp. LRF_L2]|uniref:SusC/RagA family TonB-linked outer membrane protein n=1 Tax=Sphingobacterium sp. LRF_L2 TaxID=3369421 RepID=UPI003F618941
MGLLLEAPDAFAQKDPLINSTLSGQVRDSISGRPLVGVSVKIEGVTNQTQTDEDGHFELITGQSLPYPIVVSFVGYQTKRIQAKISPTNILLAPADNDLDEVVVVGFGRQKRTDMVGSVSSVNPSQLKVPSSNLTTALAGRIAGIIGYQRSGEPGADNADFFIRGVTTFGYKVDPLILVDNIEVTKTDLARLQVDDIASFSIMKDATATAIYGARGANGVILVTTKEGKEGKAAISFRLENSFSRPTRSVELADPITYMRLNNEAVLTRDPIGILPYSDNKIDQTIAGNDPYLYPQTDWQQVLLKNYTVNQRANLSVSGGGAVARYFVSGAVNRDNGVLKVPSVSNFNSNIDLKSYSLRSNVNINIFKGSELGIRLHGSFDDYIGPIDGGTKVYRDIMRTNPVLFSPFYPVQESTQYVKHILFGNYGEANYLNPYADMVKGYKEYSSSNILAQLEFKQDLSILTKGLSFRTLFNTGRYSYFDVKRNYTPFYYSINGLKENGDYNLTLLNEASGTEYLNYSEGTKTVESTTYLETALNYNQTFEKHTISALLVGILRNRLAGNAGDLQKSLPYRNVGVSGRFTYAHDSRYFVEFNFGYNGSERFYETNRFGFFPSAGLAWSISNERFWEPFKEVVSNLRLRATYGLVGNDDIGDASTRFFYLSNVDMNNSDRSATFGLNRAYSRTGIAISRYSNPNISWETSRKTNLALELGLFNKLQLQADFFHDYRSNILMARTDVPTTVGLASTVYANVGEASSRGVDISLDYNTNLSSSIWLQSRANFTFAKSRFEVYEEPSYNESWLSRVGQPLTQRWGYIAERLFIDDEEVANSPLQSFGEVRGGDLKYKDVNGDGQITALDRVPLGYPTTPEINYGFGVSLGNQNWDVSAFFQGLARESFWINTAATSPFASYTYDGESFTSGTVLQNQLLKAYADDHWSEDNQNLYALWPRLGINQNQNNQQDNSWFMRNGAFLRLKQVELGYTLSPSVSKKIRMEKVRVYGNATNLVTWSSFKLWDVEMAGNGLGYPIQRVFNLGILASF